MQVDWLIKNVTVIDGSGGPEFRGDVAITGDRIVDIAPALNVTAQQVIDGEGRVLSGWKMRHAGLPARVREEHSETAYSE